MSRRRNAQKRSHESEHPITLVCEHPPGDPRKPYFVGKILLEYEEGRPLVSVDSTPRAVHDRVFWSDKEGAWVPDRLANEPGFVEAARAGRDTRDFVRLPCHRCGVDKRKTLADLTILADEAFKNGVSRIDIAKWP